MCSDGGVGRRRMRKRQKRGAARAIRCGSQDGHPIAGGRAASTILYIIPGVPLLRCRHRTLPRAVMPLPGRRAVVRRSVSPCHRRDGPQSSPRGGCVTAVITIIIIIIFSLRTPSRFWVWSHYSITVMPVRARVRSTLYGAGVHESPRVYLGYQRGPLVNGFYNRLTVVVVVVFIRR